MTREQLIANQRLRTFGSSVKKKIFAICFVRTLVFFFLLNYNKNNEKFRIMRLP